LGGFLEILGNISTVFCLFVTKSLKLRKVSLRPEAVVCNVLMPAQATVSGFTRNPAFLAVSEFFG